MTGESSLRAESSGWGRPSPPARAGEGSRVRGAVGRGRRSSPLGLAPLLVVLLAFAGCGKKGDPQPPIRLIPAPTTDLTAVQRNGDVLLDFAYPQTTAAGTPLSGLSEIAVWELVWRVPAGSPTPTSVDAHQFLAGARPVEVLGQDDLSAAIDGDRVRLSVPVPPAPSAAPEPTAAPAPAATADTPAAPPAAGQAMVALAVKTQGPSGAESALSNLIAFPIQAAPAPPTGLGLEATANGVNVRWSYTLPETAPPAAEPATPPMATEGTDAEAAGAPDEPATAKAPAEAASTDGMVTGFNVYRRQATERRYGQPLRFVGAGVRSFVDESALFGQRYIYTVTAVSARQPVLVESPFAEEVEVEYQDRYPPPAPEGLVALYGEGRVRLVWKASQGSDLAGYKVYRRGPDTQEFRPLTAAPVTATELVDRDLAEGASYTYQVTAVDRLGNESRPSEPATAQVR